MSRIEVNRIAESSERQLPIFEEFEQLADRIRMQAFRLFSRRGAGDGHALDDWLAAERELCWPAAELSEADGQYALKVALAGFEPKEISVTATPREILIKAGRRHQESGDEDGSTVRWSEFSQSDVLRRVELPGDIDIDRIAASFSNGLLNIVAPKAKAPKQAAQKVEVSAKS